MSNNTSKPTNTEATKSTKKQNTKKIKKNKDKKVSSSHISMPGGKKMKMNFVTWVVMFTFIFLLILVLVTWPNRMIRNHLMSVSTRDEAVQYCEEKGLNCYFSTLSDYDIEGYHVTRVSFLSKDFFGQQDTSTSESKKGNENNGKNVYLTVQKGREVKGNAAKDSKKNSSKKADK